MNNQDTIQFVDSGRYRPFVVPANPPSFWTQVDSAAHREVVMDVLQMTADRDSELVQDEEVRGVLASRA